MMACCHAATLPCRHRLRCLTQASGSGKAAEDGWDGQGADAGDGDLAGAFLLHEQGGEGGRARRTVDQN